jgi:hypothetical protein
MYVHKPIIDAFDLVNFPAFLIHLRRVSCLLLSTVRNSPFYFLSLYFFCEYFLSIYIVLHTEGLGTRRVELKCREFLHLFLHVGFLMLRDQSNFLFNDFFLHRYSLLQIHASLSAGFKLEITVRIGWNLNVLSSIHNI